MTKINIDKIARRVENGQWARDTDGWLDAKSIDDSSLDKYLQDMSWQGLKAIMGELAVTNNREAAAREFYDLLGTVFQLGYTTCELQSEKDYLTDEPKD